MSESPAESAVPIWPHFLPHVLRVLNSGESLPRRDLVGRVLESAELSEAALGETIAAGDGRAANRVGWALTNLYKAGWVERPQRAVYRITEAGRAWFMQNPDASLCQRRVNLDPLSTFENGPPCHWCYFRWVVLCSMSSRRALVR